MTTPPADSEQDAAKLTSAVPTLQSDSNAMQHDLRNERHPIVFFDGVCGLCNAAVDYILRNDPKGVFRFSPLQGDLAARLLPHEDIASLKTLVLVDDAGIHRRSTAVWRILRGLGGSNRLLGALLWLVPWPLRDLGYRVTSAVRYRLFGKKETCRLPTPEERSRFV